MADPQKMFPFMQVMRSKNWGFLLQSCWAILLSYPIPLFGVDLELEKQCEIITTADQVKANVASAHARCREYSLPRRHE